MPATLPAIAVPPVAVPRCWPDSTIAIIAGGPSVSVDAIDQVRAAGCRILAIKDAIRLCPDADALYACDAKWWKHYGPTLTYGGPKYALEAAAAPWATVLRNTGQVGLEPDPTGLRTGKNSGYQAINLAVHFGAARILLIGYDMRAVKDRHHWFGGHPYRAVDPPYTAFRELFPSLVDPLAAAGVAVLNCTPQSALTCFPAQSLVDALVSA